MDTLNWPLTTGCETLGGGCDSCPSLWEYREKGWDYQVKTHPSQLMLPKINLNPTVYTVSLGSDLFHESVSSLFIEMAFQTMNQTPQHQYEIITKRAERLEKMSRHLNWTENISIGVTVEEAKYKSRIDYLRKVPTMNRFISFIPLLGSVGKLDLSGIKFAGAAAEDWGLMRKCEDSWAEELKDQCLKQGVGWLSGYNIYIEKQEV